LPVGPPLLDLRHRDRRRDRPRRERVGRVAPGGRRDGSRGPRSLSDALRRPSEPPRPTAPRTDDRDPVLVPRRATGSSARVRVLHVRNSDRFGGPERLIVEHAARTRATAPTIASFGRAGDPHPLLDAARDRGIATALLEQSGSYDPRVVERLRRAIGDA